MTIGNNIKVIQPVQIIGTQRSGSNLLRLLLNEITDVVAPHPPHILQNFVPLVPRYGDLNLRENMLHLVEDVCAFVESNQVPWTNLLLNPDLVLSQCKVNSIFEIFRVIYNVYAQSQSATHWVCKSTFNIHYSDELEKWSKQPKYLYLYRDGRDVACSFKNISIGEKHAFHLAKTWAHDQKACLELEKNVSSQRFYRIKYENLIAEPEFTMQRLCEFLGVKYDCNIFNFYQSEESRKTAQAGDRWLNVRKPILRDNYDIYKNILTLEEIKIFDRVAGKQLMELGYPVNSSNNPENGFYSEEEIQKFDLENQRLKMLRLEKNKN